MYACKRLHRDAFVDGGCTGSSRHRRLKHAELRITKGSMENKVIAYRNPVGIFLSDALGLGLALLEGVLVLELRAHDGSGRVKLQLGPLGDDEVGKTLLLSSIAC